MKDIKVGYKSYKVKNLDSIVSKCNEINGQFLASDGMIALSSTEDSADYAEGGVNKDFPKDKKSYVDGKVFTMADEKDY
jgi:hypothetical protein